MKSLRLFVRFIAVAAAGVVSPPAFGQDAASVEFFESKVRPLLAEKCWGCHGPERQESDLRLDSAAALAAGGASGPTVAPGDIDNSLLVVAVRREDGLEMPPDEPLESEEIAALEAWIAAGAHFPANESSPQPVDRLAEAQEHLWSLQPVSDPQPPVTAGVNSDSPVDAFVDARLQAAGVTPNDGADRRTLLRRATVDLVGLPLGYDEARAFEEDEAPDAYLRRLDALLASPAYGERWGRHWLDVARYADTRGYALGGRTRRFAYAWTYRDYVIDAFNRDLPYDRFVIEQLAADLDEQARGTRALAALGFLTVGRQFLSNHDTIDDRIDAATRGLLGITVACARCHDHKYDPIKSSEYYGLYGVMSAIHEPSELPLIGEPEENEQYVAYQRGLDERQSAYDNYRNEQHEALRHELRQRIGEYLVAAASEAMDTGEAALSFAPGELRPQIVDRWRRHLAARKPEDPCWGPWATMAKWPEAEFAERAAAWQQGQRASVEPTRTDERILAALLDARLESMLEVASVYGDVLQAFYEETSASSEARRAAEERTDRLLPAVFFDASPASPMDDAADKVLDRATKNRLNELRQAIDQYELSAPGAPPRAMAVADDPDPKTPVVFVRGDPARRGEPTERRMPSMAVSYQPAPYEQGSGRLQFAREIVDPANPLAARVLVNRVWMHHFGTPLVGTPSDFGSRSDPPTHPQLLDHLATELVAGDWSIKRLHRMLMTSATYGRSSAPNSASKAIDSENLLLWQANRRRLELEPLLDALLAVGGRLDRQLGGRPIEPGDAVTAGRRAVYLLVDRQDLPNLFRSFDFASPDTSTPQRPETTTPQQALFLMNGESAAAAGDALAARTAHLADPRERAAELVRLTLGRDATDEERTGIADYVDAASAEHAAEAWSEAAQSLLMSNEFNFVD